MKTTLKDIKDFRAVDLTTYDTNSIYTLLDEEKTFKLVAYAVGIYGINGVVVQGYTSNTLYKITSRNNNLFIIV